MTTRAEPSGEIQLTLQSAAEHRSAGTGWELTAAHVQTPTATLRKWVRQYPELWRRFLQEARQATIEEAEAEAICVLRTQLRTEDDKLKIDAAKKLIDHSEHQRPKNSAEATASPLTAIAIYLEGLSDDQLQQHLTELQDRSESEHAAA